MLPFSFFLFSLFIFELATYVCWNSLHCYQVFARLLYQFVCALTLFSSVEMRNEKCAFSLDGKRARGIHRFSHVTPARKQKPSRSMDIKPALGTTAQVVLSSLGAEEPEREQTSRGARGILQWSLRWLRQYPSPSPRSGPASPRLRLRLLPLLRRRRRRRSRGWLRCKDQNSSTSSTFYLHT